MHADGAGVITAVTGRDRNDNVALAALVEAGRNGGDRIGVVGGRSGRRTGYGTGSRSHYSVRGNRSRRHSSGDEIIKIDHQSIAVLLILTQRETARLDLVAQIQGDFEIVLAQQGAADAGNRRIAQTQIVELAGKTGCFQVQDQTLRIVLRDEVVLQRAVEIKHQAGVFRRSIAAHAFDIGGHR